MCPYFRVLYLRGSVIKLHNVTCIQDGLSFTSVYNDCIHVLFLIPSPVQFIHSLFVLLCLGVICVVKPYKKYHINFMEVLVTLCLFGATLALLDENDIYAGSKTSAAFISFPFMYAFAFIAYRGVRKLGDMCW